MVPIVSFIGYSDSGKTTFIENLIPALKARGLRVGVIKHDVHGFDADREGKDTWRFTRSGADAAAIVSPGAACVFLNMELELDDIRRMIPGVDIIIAEGFKGSGVPKLEVHRIASGQPRCEGVSNIIALVTDSGESAQIPRFGLNDYESAAAFIVERFL